MDTTRRTNPWRLLLLAAAAAAGIFLFCQPGRGGAGSDGSGAAKPSDEELRKRLTSEQYAVTQNEASRMLERRFGGIDRAQRFIADNSRPGAPDFQFSETFMGGFLGDRWRDRLKRSALPFQERRENGQTSVFVAFAPFCAAAERALRSVAARKAR